MGSLWLGMKSMKSYGSICDTRRSRSIHTRAVSIKDRVYTKVGVREIETHLKYIVEASTKERAEVIGELASKIIEKAYYIQDTEPELRVLLSKLRIRILTEDKNSISGFESFNELRKRYFGRLRISNKGLPVDVVYQELSMKYPWLFDCNIDNTEDELARILSVADKLRPTKKYVYSKRTSDSYNEIKAIIWGEVRDMIHNIAIRFDIGQVVYMVVNDGKGAKKVESGKVKEVSLDKKGWHMHIGPRRYGLESPLVFETSREAEEKADSINNKRNIKDR